MIYIFNNYLLDTDNFTLKNKNNLLEVEPQVFNLIVYLIENKSKLVSRDELLNNVWQGRLVLDATLNNHIKAARKALGDDGHSQKVIKTIHGRGYQFIAEVKTDSINLENKTALDKWKKYTPHVLLLLISFVMVFYISRNSHLFQPVNNQGIKENHSIAVLAFLDLSPEQNQEYFSDGMSEEILNKLAKIPELRVISRTSSFFFKGKNKSAATIGEQLNVSHILEGSVRKDNNKIRITVQLIDSKTSAHLWSETYDKTLNDVFQIQDDIAEAVSEKLKISLLKKPKYSYIPYPDAYITLLQAKHLIQKSTRNDLKKAEILLRQSLAFDPKYAQTWQQLGKTIFSLTFNHGARSTNEGLRTSSYAVKTAIELNPDYAPSYATLARIQSQQRYYNEAENTMKKALQLDSNNSYINAVAASNAMFAGNFKLALEFRAKVSNIDPKYFQNYYGIGLINFLDNNIGAAYTAFKKYEKFNPNKDALNYMICSLLLQQGNIKKAIEYANKETDGFWKLYALNLAIFANGEIDKSNRLLNQFIERYQSSDLANIARIYAFRGDTEKSFEWLNKAIDYPDSTLIFLLNFPDFRKMHQDTRWHQLIRKMNFPDTHWLVKKLPK